ncbi:unnamed protein product, partial [Notodromas monacha]
SKIWISNADVADIFLVMANVDPSKKYKGITCFIVEKGTPGFSIAKKEKKLGLRASATCVLNFEDVHVPDENILGNVGEGYKYAISSLNEGRIGIGAQMVGLAQGCLDIAIPYTLQRSQFGKKLFEFQAMQHQISRACMKLECARLLVYNAARLKEANLPFVKEACMAKLFCSATKFAREKIQPLVMKMDEDEKFDPGMIKDLFENGFMGLEIPEEFGGAGTSFFQSLLVIEEISRVDPTVGILVDIQNTLINALISSLGTKAQREKYLPRLAQQTAGSFCLSEPESGSDAFAMKTRAEKVTGGYVINGSKIWISNADVADIFLVMANVDPSKKYKGITCFIVEKGTPGFSIAKKEKKLGLRASATCVLNFEDVHVPDENILGNVGEGYKYAISSLNEGRIGIGAQMVGLAQGCLDIAIPYTLQRSQFGKKLFEFQAMQHQISRACMKLECARLLVYNAARLKEANLPFVKEACMAKLFCSETAQEIASQAVDWMGGMGFVRDSLVEKYYRDSKIGTIYEGTSNIQLNTMAARLKQEWS